MINLLFLIKKHTLFVAFILAASVFKSQYVLSCQVFNSGTQEWALEPMNVISAKTPFSYSVIPLNYLGNNLENASSIELLDTASNKILTEIITSKNSIDFIYDAHKECFKKIQFKHRIVTTNV